MVNQILKATEEWLQSNLRISVQSDPSLFWETAEQTVIEEIHDVKRWFDYLKEKDVIPQHFRLEAFTIPRLDSFEGDDMLVVYQEGALWTGYPLTRFTSFTNNWNKQGLIDFLHTLFPSLIVGEKVGKESLINEETDSVDLTGWISINGDDLEVETDENDLKKSLFHEEEEQLTELDEEEFSDFDEEELNDEAGYQLDESGFDEDFNDDLEIEVESEGKVDADYVVQLLEGINVKLSDSIVTVEECVQEAIDLAAQKKGSKKLVRLILKVEEELTELNDQLTNPIEIDEE